jgi:AcrR family transcriptional regulator
MSKESENNLYQKRKVKALNTKNKILKASIKLFKEKGYNNVTIDEISKECGFTKGAFYHHFDSKESIIRSIYITADSEILKNISEILKKENSLEQSMDILTFYAKAAQNRGVEFMKLFIRTNLGNEEVVEIFDPSEREAIKISLDIIKKGQEKGEIRNDMEYKNIFWHMICSYNGILLDWCYKNGSYDLVEKVKSEMPLVFENFKAKK